MPSPSAANGSSRTRRPHRRSPRRARPGTPWASEPRRSHSIVPSRSSTPARILVPPRSTPMTRCALTGRGYHTRTDAGGREALSPLQGWASEGQGAAAGPSRRRTHRAAATAAAPRWGRRIGLTLRLLVLLLAVWGVLELPLLSRRRRGRQRATAPARSSRAWRNRTALLLSEPTLSCCSEPTATAPRPARTHAAPTRSWSCAPTRAGTASRSSRSRATFASTFPATARTRSTPPSSSAGLRSR